MGMDYLPGFSGYNAHWRRQRAHLKQSLSVAVIKRDYSALLETKARQYLTHCSARPEESVASLNRYMGELIIELTYGRLANEDSGDYVERSAAILQAVIQVTQGHVVDLLPFLKYLPSWLPGMGFKRYAAKWSKEIEDTRRAAFETARETALSGDPNLPPSYIINKLRALYNAEGKLKDAKAVEEEERAIDHSGFTGVDTSESTLESLVLAMALFPSVQEKVHAELDRIVGQDRLPTFEDQQALAYLHAVVLETLRWHPVGTVGLPHTSLTDDTYQGYFIPKETAVIVNVWGISRNTKYYSNPSAFYPERFTKPIPELDPRRFAFGFGRRICPGNDLAFQSIWILAASILWGFEIRMTQSDAAALREDTNKFSFGIPASNIQVPVCAETQTLTG
ncbi:hypothetical protein FRC01_006592 [Tulasnella sp. 417]|nr:hypothetical protein FRC01_006592 [Tulasnella sp. 417]